MKLALGILSALLLVPGGCAPASEPTGPIGPGPAGPIDPGKWHIPAASHPGTAIDPTAAAGEKAMARLLELGARVFCRSQEAGEEIKVQFYRDWRGSGADLDLLNAVAELGTMDLMIDFRTVAPVSFAELKLRKPLVELDLIAAPDAMFDHLATLPPIKNLVLSDWQLTPEGCRRLVKAAPDVENLTLKRYTWNALEQKPSKLTDAVAAEFGGLVNLKSLKLESAAITGTGLKHLSGMKRLERLVLDVCPALAKSDLAGLADFESLRSLELYFPLNAGSLATLGKLRKLEKLHFEISVMELHDTTPMPPDGLRPADFEPLAGMSDLRELEVGSMMCFSLGSHSNVAPVKLGSGIARAAGRMPRLRSLAISSEGGDSIDRKSLAVLASSASLEDLSVSVSDLDDHCLEPLSGMAHLRKLRLGSLPNPGKVTDEGLAYLAKASELVTLSLPVSHQVTDDGLADLARLTGLKELSLWGDAIITDDGLAHLAGLTALEKLNLSSKAITEEGVTHLVGLTALKELNFSGSRFYGMEMEVLGGQRMELARPGKLAPE